MTEAEKRLRRAAARSVAARAELDEQIRAARAAGMPVRQIAPLVGLSPEWVRQIGAGTASR